MAYIYSSNSPYYFEYLASCRTRDEILNDPELCQYLEDPALKDNMEIALSFKAAKRGGYEEKKAFVEYLLCNGPDLDTDTLLYYREKCYQDPIYLQISEIEFNDYSIIDNLRATKYGKSNDLEDCFTKPCNYLGPMSGVVGLMGDSNNFKTLPNIFSTLLSGSKEDKENLKAAWGNIREHLTSKIVPNIRKACQVLYDNMYNHMKEFAEECQKAGITDSAEIGDKYSIGRSEDIAASTKVNINNKLGDCARLWEHMRRFNPYDVNQNQKGSTPEHKLVDNKALNGASIDQSTPPTVVSKLPTNKLKEAAASGNKTAQWEIDLQNIPFPVTASDYEYITSDKHSEEEKLEYLSKLLDGGTASLTRFRTSRDEFNKKYQNNFTAVDKLEEEEEKYRQRSDELHVIYEELKKKKQEKYVEQIRNTGVGQRDLYVPDDEVDELTPEQMQQLQKMSQKDDTFQGVV